MNSESELLTALAQIEPIVQESSEYRVYYNDIGEIIQCSMREHPSGDNYLIVTFDQYNNYFRYTVVDDKLKKIDIVHSFHVQLKKSSVGYQVVKNHAGLLLEPDETFSETEYYDTTNN